MQKNFQLLYKNAHVRDGNMRHFYILSEDTVENGKTVEQKRYDTASQMVYTLTNDGKTLNVAAFSEKGALDNVPAVFQQYLVKGGADFPPVAFPKLTVDVPSTAPAKALPRPFKI